MKINIIGDIFGTSGFAVHTRNLANALHEAGAEVRIESNKPQDWYRYVTDSELLMLNRNLDKEYISILIGHPQWIDLVKSSNCKKSGVFVVFEGDKIPKFWIKYLLKCDFVLCPSLHVLEAIKKTCTEIEWDRIKNILFIIPHGVDQNLFPLLERNNEKFTFLYNKGWKGGNEDRGGLQYLLKAFDEEFGKEKDVRLLVHINPAYLPPYFNLDKEFINLGLPLNREVQNILINFGNLQQKELLHMYKEGDVYVCPTRAEGFNIAGLEAKSTGIPTIQTGYGGQLDYMSENDYKIDYDLVEVTHDITYEGIKWAVPDINHLKKIMREVYNNRDEIKKKSNTIREEIKDYTWLNSAKKLINNLKNII